LKPAPTEVAGTRHDRAAPPLLRMRERFRLNPNSHGEQARERRVEACNLGSMPGYSILRTGRLIGMSA